MFGHLIQSFFLWLVPSLYIGAFWIESEPCQLNFLLSPVYRNKKVLLVRARSKFPEIFFVLVLALSSIYGVIFAFVVRDGSIKIKINFQEVC